MLTVIGVMEVASNILTLGGGGVVDFYNILFCSFKVKFAMLVMSNDRLFERQRTSFCVIDQTMCPLVPLLATSLMGGLRQSISYIIKPKPFVLNAD